MQLSGAVLAQGLSRRDHEQVSWASRHPKVQRAEKPHLSWVTHMALGWRPPSLVRETSPQGLLMTWQLVAPRVKNPRQKEGEVPRLQCLLQPHLGSGTLPLLPHSTGDTHHPGTPPGTPQGCELQEAGTTGESVS